MITIDTQPKNPPPIWVLSRGLTGQIAVIESDHLVLTTSGKHGDKIHRLPLQSVVRIYIAREPLHKVWRSISIALLLMIVLIVIASRDALQPSMYWADLIMYTATVVLGVVLMGGLLAKMRRPAHLIYLVGGPRPWGFRAKFPRHRLDEFIDALRCQIIKCQQTQPEDGGTGRVHDLAPLTAGSLFKS